MNRCANCRHWKTHEVIISQAGTKKTEPRNSLGPNSGYPENWGECARAGDADALFDAACFAEGISGNLVTASTFGCIEWSEGTEADHITIITLK